MTKDGAQREHWTSKIIIELQIWLEIVLLSENFKSIALI